MKIIKSEAIRLTNEELKLIEDCNNLIGLIHTQTSCLEIEHICDKITESISELWTYIE